ncbi:MAG: hypothetical protein HKN45_09520, partial [Flavobacteriales bacterium]|nr:hypothetical protein [Flavobacteriales bacterium]
MKFFLSIHLVCLSIGMLGQYNWTWEELPLMPEAISNNAVAQGVIGEDVYVYTFSGIDTTKTNEGISLVSMRYSMNEGQWDYIEDLPDTLGKIAAAASSVDNIIYIIGGYHVFDGAPFELSSDRVHRYCPETNSYLQDGASIPFAIDDQVQAVWRDSLIYVVTGWSNTQNVEYVQIYNPSIDEWQQGTPVPNGTVYEAFGASGTI